MNPIQKLLSEQKEEFETLAHAYQEGVQPPNCEEFGEGYWEGIKYGQSYITTAQQQLIDVIIKDIQQRIKKLRGMVFMGSENPYETRLYTLDDVDIELTNLIEEVKKNI